MRHIGPKNRIARMLATDLSMKTVGSKSHANLLKKINVKPGQHGARTRRKSSEHGKQLHEKQKLRFLFGLSESQLKKYFEVASKKKGNTAIHLGEILERRLDNVVYRLGLAPTRAAARQLVNHGHMTVNGKVLDIPSYLVKPQDMISYKSEQSKKIPYIQGFREQSEIIIPEWFNMKKETGTLLKLPDNSLIAQQINLRLVIEFYSR